LKTSGLFLYCFFSSKILQNKPLLPALPFRFPIVGITIIIIIPLLSMNLISPPPFYQPSNFFSQKTICQWCFLICIRATKEKKKTIGNKVNSLKTKPYSVFTELTSGKKKQLWFGLKPSWIDFIGFDMITMLKLIIPLKEHYYNSFIWLWKKSMLSSKNKNFQKKRCKKTYYT